MIHTFAQITQQDWLINLVDTLADGFYQNLIHQNRFMYLINGLKMTLLVTLFSCLLGILLGMIVTYLKMSKFWLFRFIANIYLTIIRGTPSVVQLMIIYYVVFGHVDINKIAVASIAFGINSGAYVSEIFRSGILSVDKGQTEAGRSLGLSATKTMVLIVLPQAIKNVLPALFNEAIVLLKETAVMGYIGLQDLARGGDIIRSQTYAAYFPLLTMALIYLVVVMLLSYIFGLIEKRMRLSDNR